MVKHELVFGQILVSSRVVAVALREGDRYVAFGINMLCFFYFPDSCLIEMSMALHMS